MRAKAVFVQSVCLSLLLLISISQAFAAQNCSQIFLPPELHGQLSEMGPLRASWSQGRFLFKSRDEAAQAIQSYGRIPLPEKGPWQNFFKNKADAEALNARVADYVAKQLRVSDDEIMLEGALPDLTERKADEVAPHGWIADYVAQPEGEITVSDEAIESQGPAIDLQGTLFSNFSIHPLEFAGFFALHLDNGVGDGAKELVDNFNVPRVIENIDIRIPLKPLQGTDWVSVNLRAILQRALSDLTDKEGKEWTEALRHEGHVQVGEWDAPGLPGKIVSVSLSFANVGRLQTRETVQDAENSLYIHLEKDAAGKDVDPELVIRLEPRTEDGELGAWEPEFQKFLVEYAAAWGDSLKPPKAH